MTTDTQQAVELTATQQALADMGLSQSPPILVEGEPGWEAEFIVSTYHWLDDMLEYAPDMQALFESYTNFVGDLDHIGWLKAAERFAETWQDQDKIKYRYHDSNIASSTAQDSWLDAHIQYVTFTHELTDYVAVQYGSSHNDRPRIFTICDSEGPYAFYYEGRISVTCTQHQGQYLGEGLFGPVDNPMHAWDSNGCEWTDYDGCCADVEFTIVDDPTGYADDRRSIGAVPPRGYIACPACGSPMSTDVMFGN